MEDIAAVSNIVNRTYGGRYVNPIIVGQDQSFYTVKAYNTADGGTIYLQVPVVAVPAPAVVPVSIYSYNPYQYYNPYGIYNPYQFYNSWRGPNWGRPGPRDGIRTNPRLEKY